MKTLITFLATLCLAAPTFAQIDQNYLDSVPVENVFKIGNEYRYVLPSHQVFYGAVAGVQARMDSRYVAFVADPQANRAIPYFPDSRNLQAAENSKPGIYTLDLASGQSKLAYPIDTKTTELNYYAWVNGTPYLAVSINQKETTTLFFVDPINGSKQAIYATNEIGFNSPPLFQKASNSIVIFRQSIVEKQPVSQATIINLSNNSRRTIPLPKGEYWDFVSDGNRIVNLGWDRQGEKIVADSEFDLNTGTINAIIEPNFTNLEPPYSVNRGGPILRIYDPAMDVYSKTPPSRQKSANLTMNGTEGGATLNGQLAWYVDRSGLFLADVRPMNFEQYTELVKEVVKYESIMRAKQVGTGMLIYASDYDDMLPTSSGWDQSLQPYLRNNSLTNGFNYLLNGENLTEIDDPANRVLGMIQTPFGQATVRVDGSVIWKDRPKVTETKVLSELRN
ncbi:MAG: hypothetical protein ACKVQS_02485 [Fimbriimonadaceae bacterium]